MTAVRALFVRIYGAVALVLVGAVVGAVAWGAARRGAPPRFVALAADAPGEVRHAFGAGAPDELVLRGLSDRLDAEVELVPPDAVPLPVRPRLTRGLVAPPGPGRPPDLFVPLADGRVVRLRPQGLPDPLVLPLVLGGVVLALGVAVAVQLRPLDRALRQLDGAAVRLGGGDLGARAALPPGSPLVGIGARFDAMAERVGALLSAREELLLAVSHELRRPLQRLRFSVELAVDAAPDERARLADGIQRDLDALDALVEELLTWGRLDRPLERGPIDLGDLAARAATEAGRLRDGVTVHVAGEGRAEGDAALIRRALDNLLANAVRHARSAVHVRVDGPVVAVDDDGPGIPAADRARVLEPFVRLDAARTSGGAGLGLALVDKIARAHGGRVEIADGASGGARVVLALAPGR